MLSVDTLAELIFLLGFLLFEAGLLWNARERMVLLNLTEGSRYSSIFVFGVRKKYNRHTVENITRGLRHVVTLQIIFEIGCIILEMENLRILQQKILE